MKSIVLAAGFAALGTVDLAFIDLRLVPAVLAIAPAAPGAPGAPGVREPAAPPKEATPRTAMAMASPSPPIKDKADPIKEKAEPAPRAEAAPTLESPEDRGSPRPTFNAEDRGSPRPTFNAVETRGGGTVTLHFDVNARLPGSDSAPDLRTVATMLAADPALQVTIDGHSDRNGSVAYNDELSRQRALAVAEELADLGIDRRRISSAAHGARAPIAKGTDPESLALNRRVELHVERRKP